MKYKRIIKGILSWVYALAIYNIFDMLNEYTIIGSFLTYNQNNMDKTVIGLLLTIIMIVFWTMFALAGIRQFKLYNDSKENEEIQNKSKKGCSWWNPFC